MKEHPDYKYRPRRKPKSIAKKENKYGYSLSPLMSSGDTLNNISRGLLPPLAPTAHHPLLSHEDLKIPRFFPPFPYSLYPVQHKLGDDFNGSKLAADLAFQAFYGSGTFYSSHQAVWPGLSPPPCVQPNCGYASSTHSSKDSKRSAAYLIQAKPEDRTFGGAVKIEEDRYEAECNRIDERYRKLDEALYPSGLDKHDEIKSEERYSPTPSTCSFDRKPENTFSVQSLTANTPMTPRTHVIWRPLPVLPDLNFRGNLISNWTPPDWWRVPTILSPSPQATVTASNLTTTSRTTVNIDDDDNDHEQNSNPGHSSRNSSVTSVEWISCVCKNRWCIRDVERVTKMLIFSHACANIKSVTLPRENLVLQVVVDVR